MNPLLGASLAFLIVLLVGCERQPVKAQNVFPSPTPGAAACCH
ncbi:hypothetical protein [Terrimicrobium sacchariphilum]|nr:hypothetical protein [Terrimicrobium sacchariphilum]